MEVLLLLPLLLLAGFVVDTSASDTDEPPLPGGTSGDDSLTGTPAAEGVNGLTGNDTIRADGGDDTIAAGTGDDVVSGGTGDDVVGLGAGNDSYVPDFIDEFTPNDGGNDTVFGEDGSDLILDAFGADEFHGGAGNDALVSVDDGPSPTPADTMYGGAGDDTLGGDDGDRLYGGEGTDRFVMGLNAEDRGDQWVRIMDFNPAAEVIDIEVNYGPNIPVITFEAGNSGSTRLLVNGTNFALVQGVLPGDMRLENVNALRVA
jgi:Ca2+-binding RTX toxin-like protein